MMGMGSKLNGITIKNLLDPQTSEANHFTVMCSTVLDNHLKLKKLTIRGVPLPRIPGIQSFELAANHKKSDTNQTRCHYMFGAHPAGVRKHFLFQFPKVYTSQRTLFKYHDTD